MSAVFRPPFFVPPPVLWVPAKNHVFGAATMSGAGDLTASGKLPISSISDNFDDNVVAAKWSETETAGALVNETGERLELALPGAAVAEASLRSVGRYDLTGDSVYVRMVSPGLNNSANLLAIWGVYDAGATSNVMWFAVAANNTVFGYTLAGVDNQTTLSYSATNHAWMRLQNSGANILWQTSADGQTWTTRRTVATPITITDLQVRIGHVTLTAGPGASTAIFDNLNTVAGAATMSGAGALTAAGKAVVYGAATMSGAGALTATGTRVVFGAATMSGAGALTAAGKVTVYGAATMAGAGALTADGHVKNQVDMSGMGALTADGFSPVYERPDGTVTTNGWTAVGAGTLWEAIDETQASDSDYIVSAASPVSPDICEVSLSNLSNPGVDTGHLVRYRFRKDTPGGDAIDLTVSLVQGVTVIASWTETDIEALTDVIRELTTAEAANITDYTDLRLRFEAVKA